jgi:hypothetical protein
VRSETHYLIALAKRRQVLKSVWILALNPKRIKARKDQTDDKGEQQTNAVRGGTEMGEVAR